MAANAQLFRQRKGIRFRLEIDFVDFVRVEGAEEMLRLPPSLPRIRASRADLPFRGLNDGLERKLTGLVGHQPRCSPKGNASGESVHFSGT
jgi:hypothetical protein